MGLLDELKKLTKPYDDEDYLEENLAEPVRVGGQAGAQSYTAYAEPPRTQQTQTARRPYTVILTTFRWPISSLTSIPSSSCCRPSIPCISNWDAALWLPAARLFPACGM